MKKKGLVHDILMAGSGSLFSQLIYIALTPVITRLYTPEHYALWALFISLFSILGTIATLRYELAIVLPKNEREGANVFTLSLLISLLLCLVFGTLLLQSSALILPLLGLESLRSVHIAYGSLLILTMGTFASCRAWCTRTGNFGLFATGGIMVSFCTALSQIGFGLAGLRSGEGLIYGSVLGQTLAALLLLVLILKRDSSKLLSHLSLSTMIRMLSTYKNYPLYMTPYTFVVVARARITIFILNAFGSKTEIGQFAFAEKILNLPVGLINNALRPVLFQRASQSDVKSVETFINQVLELLTKIIPPLWIFLFFFAEEIFAFVFGEEWRNAGAYGIWLSLPATIIALSGWMDRIFDVLGRQRLAFLLEFGIAIISVLGLVIFLIYSPKLLHAIALQMILMGLCYLLWILVVYQIAEFNLERLLKIALAFFRDMALWAGFFLLLQLSLPIFWQVTLYLLSSASVLWWRLRDDFAKLLD